MRPERDNTASRGRNQSVWFHTAPRWAPSQVKQVSCNSLRGRIGDSRDHPSAVSNPDRATAQRIYFPNPAIPRLVCACRRAPKRLLEQCDPCRTLTNRVRTDAASVFRRFVEQPSLGRRMRCGSTDRRQSAGRAMAPITTAHETELSKLLIERGEECSRLNRSVRFLAYGTLQFAMAAAFMGLLVSQAPC